MKKFSKTIAIIISLVMIIGLCTVTVFAEGEPIITEDMPASEFPNELFDSMMSLWAIIIFASLFSSLFLPAVVVMVIFIIKNNDVKKDLNQYEKLFGPVEAFKNPVPMPQPIPQPSVYNNGNIINPPVMNTNTSINNEGGNM